MAPDPTPEQWRLLPFVAKAGWMKAWATRALRHAREAQRLLAQATGEREET